MNEVEKLLKKWHTLCPDEEDQFIKDSVADFHKKNETEKEQFLNDLENGSAETCGEAEELIEVISIREQLEPILPYISLSTIASEYFGKSRQWIYQRVSGNLVNGKPARFTSDEKAKLKDAINDIIHKLQSVKTSLG